MSEPLPWTVAHQAPPSMGFSRQEYWSGLPFPSPGDLPDPGIEPVSPALQVDSLQPSRQGRPYVIMYLYKPTECRIPGVNPSVNYGLWVMVICSVDSLYKCTPRCGMLIVGGGCACVWGCREFMGNLCIFYSILLWPALKNKAYL